MNWTPLEQRNILSKREAGMDGAGGMKAVIILVLDPCGKRKQQMLIICISLHLQA